MSEIRIKQQDQAILPAEKPRRASSVIPVIRPRPLKRTSVTFGISYKQVLSNKQKEEREVEKPKRDIALHIESSFPTVIRPSFSLPTSPFSYQLSLPRGEDSSSNSSLASLTHSSLPTSQFGSRNASQSNSPNLSPKLTGSLLQSRLAATTLSHINISPVSYLQSSRRTSAFSLRRSSHSSSQTFSQPSSKLPCAVAETERHKEPPLSTSSTHLSYPTTSPSQYRAKEDLLHESHVSTTRSYGIAETDVKKASAPLPHSPVTDNKYAPSDASNLPSSSYITLTSSLPVSTGLQDGTRPGYEPLIVPNTIPAYKVPTESTWFRCTAVHAIEKKAFSEYFKRKVTKDKDLQRLAMRATVLGWTPERYKYTRDWMVTTWRSQPKAYLCFTFVRRSLQSDFGNLYKIFRFLEAWGLINYEVDKRTRPSLFPTGSHQKVNTELSEFLRSRSNAVVDKPLDTTSNQQLPANQSNQLTYTSPFAFQQPIHVAPSLLPSLHPPSFTQFPSSIIMQAPAMPFSSAFPLMSSSVLPSHFPVASYPFPYAGATPMLPLINIPTSSSPPIANLALASSFTAIPNQVFMDRV